MDHFAGVARDRLGNVLYWVGVVIAVPLLFVGVTGLFMSPPAHWFFAVMFCVLGATAWLIGRAARYVLAGR